MHLLHVNILVQRGKVIYVQKICLALHSLHVQIKIPTFVGVTILMPVQPAGFLATVGYQTNAQMVSPALLSRNATKKILEIQLSVGHHLKMLRKIVQTHASRRMIVRLARHVSHSPPAILLIPTYLLNLSIVVQHLRRHP